MDARGRDARAGPAPGLTGSLESLLMCLDALRERFKDAVARLVGGSAARAAAAFVRLLLGADGGNEEQDGDGYWADGRRPGRWDENEDDVIDAPQPPGRRGTLLAGLAAGLLA